ncbi:MAG: recombinase RecT [Magnetococcus sp. DMHC-1]
MKNTISQLVPKNVNKERLMQLALDAARINPSLLDCSKSSFMNAVLACAKTGLEPATPFNYIHFVPFRGKTGISEVQVILGYKGLMELALRTGKVKNFQVGTIKEGDQFKCQFGSQPWLAYTPALLDRGATVAFFALAMLVDGTSQFVVINVDDVNRIRSKARGANLPGSPWVEHFDSMGEKTALRKLCKTLQMSPELAAAIAIDEKSEVGKDFSGMIIDGDVATEEAPVNQSCTIKPLVPPPVQTQTSPVQTQTPPVQTQTSPVQTQTSPVQTQTSPVQTQTPPVQITDTKGQVWNPIYHSTGKDGKPVLNQDGTFRARRGSANQEMSQMSQTTQPNHPEQSSVPEDVF